jgi:hypothetical protein
MIRVIFIDRGNWAIAVATGFCLFGLLKLDGSMMPDVPCFQFPLGAHFEGGVFALSYRWSAPQQGRTMQSFSTKSLDIKAKFRASRR